MRPKDLKFGEFRKWVGYLWWRSICLSKPPPPIVFQLYFVCQFLRGAAQRNRT